jgi:hypothetical protein
MRREPWEVFLKCRELNLLPLEDSPLKLRLEAVNSSSVGLCPGKAVSISSFKLVVQPYNSKSVLATVVHVRTMPPFPGPGLAKFLGSELVFNKDIAQGYGLAIFSLKF